MFFACRGRTRRAFASLILCLGVVTMTCALGGAAGAEPATGPLSAGPDNPRYFADPAGKIVYLTGSHTWSNLKDMGQTDPPQAFDFPGYLDMLEGYGHNFIRLWTWELSHYSYGDKPCWTAQFPWPRTGPGMALDGKPKFDLSKLDEAYFDRLRERVDTARQRGIYVSIMLFEGHGMHASLTPWCWDGHPFNANNNINNLDGDPNGDGRGIESHTLQIPEITRAQEAYVRKVIDTVNDLDNVLYEIANEAGAYSTPWQYHLIDFIHEYEKGKPKQHPVGMTFQWAKKSAGTNKLLSDSPADWVSPNPQGGYRDNPPAANGAKVVITDTDHLWGIGGNQQWVWKSFCRGLNPIFMDPFSPPIEAQPRASINTTWTDHLAGAIRLDPKWDPVRRGMGYARAYAQRMDLRKATPHNGLASSGYCLADPGSEYLVYVPQGPEVTVDLSTATGELKGEWFNPSTGEVAQELTVPGGAKVSLKAPFEGDGVVYLRR